MATYLTPGVYYQRVDASPPAITAIRTDIAGFVGIATRGLVDAPVPVDSFRQFQAQFGTFTGVGFLAYSVRAFFENGGRRCWIVRVASGDPVGGAAPAAVQIASASPIPRDVWSISASSPGVWGDNLTVTIQETHRAQSVTIPGPLDPDFSVVASTNGFARASLVRLSQPGASTALKVVSDIDGQNQALVWLNDKPARRMVYDAPVSGFDLNRPVLIESVEYTVLVAELGVPVALYENLSLIPESAAYAPVVLAPLAIPNDNDPSQTLPPVPAPIVIEDVRPDFAELALSRTLETLQVPADPAPLTLGRDGLSLLDTYDFIGESIDPLDSDEVKKEKNRGLRTLEAIDEVAMVAIPDIHIQPYLPPATIPVVPCTPDPCLPMAPPAAVAVAPMQSTELPPVFSDSDIALVEAALVEHCENMADRIAILDPPLSASQNDALGLGAVVAWRSRFDSKYAALYYPWTRVVDPLQPANSITRGIPPSGHVAGQYANSDFTVGVHKAPANAALTWIQDVTVPLNGTQHGVLNSGGINVLRALPGRGLRIMGARTVSSDPDWIFVNIRRLMMMIEKAIYKSTQWAVFEPNNALTQANLRLSLTSFLISLWQQGALTGATASQAFFVKCDASNNPAAQTDIGQLLAEVGVAPSYPFEFVVLRVAKVGNQFEVTEQTVYPGAS
jgi:phage tail sheath protein FI